MDKFYLVAIMLFAIQYDMVDNTIIETIDAIDRMRGTTPRANYLKIVFSDAVRDHNEYNITFGKYDKYLQSISSL